jgi:hypothetical protein
MAGCILRRIASGPMARAVLGTAVALSTLGCATRGSGDRQGANHSPPVTTAPEGAAARESSPPRDGRPTQTLAGETGARDEPGAQAAGVAGATPTVTGREASDDPSEQGPLRPFPGIAVHAAEGIIELEAVTCGPDAWLEQVGCSAGSREHESLVVIRARPSHVHASLLMAGYESGKPGRWSYENGRVSVSPPEGPRLALFVRYASAAGETIEHPVRVWITDASSGKAFPDEPWVFSGSSLAPNPAWMGPGEHYVADMTGSVIGLVTFGDEVIGFSRVWADAEEAREPEWVVNSAAYPAAGTPVTLIIRLFDPPRAEGDPRRVH